MSMTIILSCCTTVFFVLTSIYLAASGVRQRKFYSDDIKMATELHDGDHETDLRTLMALFALLKGHG